MGTAEWAAKRQNAMVGRHDWMLKAGSSGFVASIEIGTASGQQVNPSTQLKDLHIRWIIANTNWIERDIPWLQ